MKETLVKIGFGEKEAELYLIISKHGKITAGEIAKISGESRTHVYDTLERLMQKGVISYVIKNNVKYFKAAGSERILDYLKERETEIKGWENEVLGIIPKIREMQMAKEKEKFNIDVYEGGEGIKTVMNDILTEGKDFVTWGATSKVNEYLPEFFIKRYLNERKNKRIRARQLFTSFYGVLKSPLSENRKLPEKFASPTTTVVYGDKVSIWLWLEIPRVILIENKELAKSYKNYFELMWKTAKK